MGYYDEKPQEPQEGQEEYRLKLRNVKKGSKGGYFFSGLIGVMIGALIVWLMLPSLVGIMPGSNTSVNGDDSSDVLNETQQITMDTTTDVTKAVEKAGDSVVGVTNIQSTSNFLSPSSEGQEAGTGSGVIYKKANGKAYVITNNHVIEGANEIEVTLADGVKVQAKLLGADIWTDLAVLEMDASKVTTVAEFGDSDALRLGEPVIAIGNPLGLNFSGSVTTGVVSGKDRTIPVDLNGDNQEDWQAEVLQTDAAINPGNSGGALVNITGQLIGINSMKISQATVEGMGLAIPVNSVIPVIEDLERFGKVKRPSMGVTLVDVTNVSALHQRETLRLPEEISMGVVIDEVIEGSPADVAGLKKYDVIVEMDGEKIENMIELRKHLYNEKEVGEDLTVKIYRGGELMESKLILKDNSAV
ncbi:S1C family serine protease [Paenisporosarcina sp. TG20]|uniref:S1C family serine protease n=1 Tax=Paenisporosarcina sp. TG20 TaxID=1211706 RepID=UPI0002DA88E6|nr:trypsin-like peptidase domain-containing protein [Paenisporosarcina sp. TG20]